MSPDPFELYDFVAREHAAALRTARARRRGSRRHGAPQRAS